MPAEISMRHRPTQFGHIFSGDHYASGYYSYMWSEVMDADAFGAFEEAGDIFDPATAKRLHDDIYSSGGSRDPEDAYVAFRGREPEPDALLRRRGLSGNGRRPPEVLGRRALPLLLPCGTRARLPPEFWQEACVTRSDDNGRFPRTAAKRCATRWRSAAALRSLPRSQAPASAQTAARQHAG